MSEFQAVSCAEAVQPISQHLLHCVECGLPCAVAGVEAGGKCQQFFRQSREPGGIAFFHEMKAADKYICPEMLGYVQDAAVGAAADENALISFLYKQVLFMSEILRHAYAVADGRHAGAVCHVYTIAPVQRYAWA